jgi:coupling of ubiquitin conjugation to ER degradation protein 1
MFPQLSRRDIAWDLQRNGGNASATTERVLSGRGLDTVSFTFEVGVGTALMNMQQPPPSFNLPTPGPTAQIRVTSARPASKPAQPDLITRYNLSSKLAQSEEPAKEEAPKRAWSADKNERQMNLQRRREEMILAARRKLEAQEKGKAPA